MNLPGDHEIDESEVLDCIDPASVWNFLDEEGVTNTADTHTESQLWHLGHPPESAPLPAAGLQSQINPSDHVFLIASLVPWIHRALARGHGCLAFLCGATCSGKTTAAQLTAQHFKAKAFVVSSDLQAGMTGKTARDASLAQYVSQLERARREPVAILYDGVHLQLEDTKEKLQLAVQAGISLDCIGWFVADQRLEEEEEVQMLMKRQQQRFARFWNTGDGGAGDAKIVSVDQVRAMVRQLRATFLTNSLAPVKWGDGDLLQMLADPGPTRHRASSPDLRGSAEMLTMMATSPKGSRRSLGDNVASVLLPSAVAPVGRRRASADMSYLREYPTAAPPHGYVVLATRSGMPRMPAEHGGSGPVVVPPYALPPTFKCDSLMSSTVGFSPGPSLGPTPLDSPFSSMRSAHSLDSPTISPSAGRMILFQSGPPSDSSIPSLSTILRKNSIQASRPLSPPRAAQSQPSPATLNAVANIVTSLHQTLQLKNTQAGAAAMGPAAEGSPATPAHLTAPLAPPAGRRNSAPVGLAPFPFAPQCPEPQPVPKELQGLLPTPPPVVLLPDQFGHQLATPSEVVLPV